MARSKLQTNDITIGKALPWAAYDQGGVLRLKKGYIIQNERQLASLLDRGLYRINAPQSDKEESPEPIQHLVSPFLLLDDIICGLTRLFTCIDFKTLSIHKDNAVFVDRLLKLARQIQIVCKQDADAVLGAVHLYHEGEYVCYHPIHSAILCEIVGNCMEISEDRRISLIAAALSQNFSIVKLQHLLTSQKKCLSSEQIKLIKAHPQQSVEILRSAGVVDEFLLNCVAQHHESLDGSGYPSQVQGDDLSTASQILGLSDRYCAMVSGRSYRAAIPAKNALREFFIAKKSEYNETLILAFIKELGIYPPGCIVKLANGETAVATRRQTDSVWPIVSAILSPRGGAYARPLQRNSDKDQYGVVDITTLDSTQPLNLHTIWDY